MNKHLLRLTEICKSKNRYIIGLMSGTSLDGLDIALCRFENSGLATKIEVLNFKTVSYGADFKAELKAVSSKRNVDLQLVTLLNAYIGTYYGELILEALTEWDVKPECVDLIASHGQTIFHAPQSIHHDERYPNATLQIGDADHIAVKTGIITLSDFRQKHIAAGGEGAPLAVYGDYLIFSDEKENRILLNIGGIANFTYLPAGFKTDNIFSTDVGTGNTLMDQYVHKYYDGKFFDEDAKIASAGNVNDALLKQLLNNHFFEIGFPKTTGPELFDLNYLTKAQEVSKTKHLTHEDVMATLAEFTARGIIEAVKRTLTGKTDFEIYLSGGGMHNPLLRKKLETFFGKTLKDTAALDVNPDAKEAVLFALLANECIMGTDEKYGDRAGIPSVNMGKISFPS